MEAGATIYITVTPGPGPTMEDHLTLHTVEHYIEDTVTEAGQHLVTL